MAELALKIKLPANFRRQDFLAFHQRDTQEIAERVSDNQLCKGIIWQARPALLEISFLKNHAEASLCFAGRGSRQTAELFEPFVAHLLGLNQSTKDFEQTFAGHAELGALISAQAGLRIPQAASAFEAISWAIIGQQISVSAAVSIRRKFIQLVAARHQSGLLAYPAADSLTGISCDTLRAAGLSQTKAATLLRLAEVMREQNLDAQLQACWHADKNRAQRMATISEQLASIRGIGPWTISYALLRGFGWLDGSLHGDVAVRRNLQRLLALDEKPDEKFTQQWLAQFAPWRALAAAHLWAMQTKAGY